ncbi:MAG: hypothetical protein ACTSPQ_03640 [Candidatus Helarchaeota archaeon]
MTIVKIKNKNELDKLVATLILRLGRKVSHQDILEACIKFSNTNIDKIEEILRNNNFKIGKNRVKEILSMADDFEFDNKNSIDEDIYGGIS